MELRASKRNFHFVFHVYLSVRLFAMFVLCGAVRCLVPVGQGRLADARADSDYNRISTEDYVEFARWKASRGMAEINQEMQRYLPEDICHHSPKTDDDAKHGDPGKREGKESGSSAVLDATGKPPSNEGTSDKPRVTLEISGTMEEKTAQSGKVGIQDHRDQSMLQGLSSGRNPLKPNG